MKQFVEPIIRVAQVKEEAIVCKRAACSGSSTHSVEIMKTVSPVTLKKKEQKAA